MDKQIKTRLLKPPSRSFFLFGPRGSGKSTWLKATFPDALYLDLLQSSLLLELSANPDKLESMITHLDEGSWVIIDEVQKVPEILNEVHRLIETYSYKFALSGSSARKLKRKGTNLLGGRALTRSMTVFSFAELGGEFDLRDSLHSGLLPMVQLDRENDVDILDSYVGTYLQQEIKEEGIIRNVAPFMRFLSIAGQLNGKVLNKANISRDAGIPRSTVDTYFEILIDTLLGYFLPAYQPHAKVREIAAPKFYWFDPGVARAAAGLLRDPLTSLWLGDSLETLILHELKVYNQTAQKMRPLYYYRTQSGTEIDLIIETRKRTLSTKAEIICIEVKYAEKWNAQWESPMRSLMETQKVAVKGMYGIYRGKQILTRDGITIFPVETFLSRLHKGEIF